MSCIFILKLLNYWYESRRIYAKEMVQDLLDAYKTHPERATIPYFFRYNTYERENKKDLCAIR